MNLKVLVVDDELPAREELKCILEELDGIMVSGECEDGEDVLAAIEKNLPDIVFLDIQMRSQDGLVTAETLLNLDKPPHIIFCTGFSQYAAKAFELNAVDYILKPYSIERVKKSVEKVKKFKGFMEQKVEQVELRSGNICVWSSERIIVIHPEKIIFARSDEKRQTLLYTEQGNYHTKFTLKELNEMLKNRSFLRTHKSYLVNLDKVREVIPWFNNTYILVLENCNETNIPVARHYIKQFNQIMGIS
jgi:DNA-binding LytR/AlgR family response regulator